MNAEEPKPASRYSERVRAARAIFGVYTLAWLLPAFVGGYSLLTMFEFHALPVPDFTPFAHEGVKRLLFDPWQHWDGQWYLRVAQTGYYAFDASTAFLPVYPWLIRFVAPLVGGDTLIAGCFISWVALAVGLTVLYGLIRKDQGEEDAGLTLVLLVAFPTAFFFHAAYTESVFLCLVVVSFAAARKSWWLLAGAAALAATLTRWTGFALVPALFVEAWSQGASRRSADGTSWRGLFTREGVRSLPRIAPPAFVGTLLPAAAFPLILYVMDRAVGDAFAWSRAQRFWERRMAPPWVGLVDGVRVLLPGHPPYPEPLAGGFPRLPDYPGGFLEAHAYNLAAAVGGLFLAYVAVKKLRPSYGVFALAGVVLPLMTPSRLQPLQSMPRFLVVLFPLFAALAVVLRGRPLLTACLIAAGAALQGFFAARFALWFWVA
jgi:hypothetical protein